MRELLDLAAPVVQIQVSQGSWLGNVGAGGVGVIILAASWIMAKKKKGIYGEWVAEKMSNVKFDWRSTISFLLGFVGVTALLGATGLPSKLAVAAQNILVWLGQIEIISALGMGVICVLIALKVWTKEYDSISDIRWGGIAAIAFPLGGGIWADMSIAAGNGLVSLLNGVPSA